MDHQKGNRLLLALTLLLFTMVTLALLGVLRGVHGFFGGDMGVKLWQIRAWAASGWRSGALPVAGVYSGWRQSFTPLVSPFFWTDPAGHIYTVYLTPFVLISGWLFERLGHTGLYLIPWISGVAGLLALYWLGNRLGFRWPGLAVVLLGLTSPWLFYSCVFWEHTPAVTLAWIGAGMVVRDFRMGRAVVAGLLVGLAAAIRPELLLFALGWLLWFGKGGDTPSLGAAAGGMLLTLFAGSALFQHRWAGVWLPAQWWANVHGGWGVRSDLQVNPPYLSVGRLFQTTRLVSAVARSRTLVGWLVGACYAFQLTNLLYLRRRRERTVERLVAWGAGAAVALVPLALIQARRDVADDLLISFPALLLLPALAWKDVREKLPSATTPLLAGVCAFLLLALLLMPNDGGLQWGPRYLLVASGPLALVVAELIARSWGERGWGWRGVVLAALAAGIAVQAVGLYTLWVHRQDAAAAESALRGKGTVVTNIWWLPYQFLPYRFPEQAPLLVRDEGEMERLVEHLREEGVSQLTYVTLADQPDPWPGGRGEKGALPSVGRSLILKWLVWTSIPTSH